MPGRRENARHSNPPTRRAADVGGSLSGARKGAGPDLIWHVDDEGICVEVAPRNQGTAHASTQREGPSKVHDLLPADASRALLRLVKKAIAAGAAQVGENNLQVNGRKALCQVQVVPYTERGALTVIRDITERIRTEMELRRSHRRLRKLTEHLQTAREEERTRIAREIHDQMGQALTALKIDLACLRSHLEGDSGRVEDDLAGMTASVETLIESVKNIAAELRPRLLDDFGLAAAVEWQIEKFAERTGISCTCSVPDTDLEIAGHAETALFRILQEALTNVSRHAQATSVFVSLKDDEHGTTLEILDDGRGVQEPDTGHPSALGVIGMQERARSLDGEATITARSSGGTRVLVRIPTGSSHERFHEERRRATDRRRRVSTRRAS